VFFHFRDTLGTVNFVVIDQINEFKADSKRSLYQLCESGLKTFQNILYQKLEHFEKFLSTEKLMCFPVKFTVQ
jgi:hypothetical protein